MSDQNSGAPKIMAFFSLLFMVLAVWFSIPSVQSIKNIYDSRLWPEVQGRVVSSDLELRFPGQGTRAGQGYRPRVLFSYDVKGKEYVSRRLRVVQDFVAQKDRVEQVVKAYPVGRTLGVRYDPLVPSVTVVESEDIPVGDCLQVALGVMILLGGMAHLVGIFRRGA